MQTVVALSAFWQTFLMLLIWIPLILMWVFALIELFKNRNRHAGWQVALWLLFIVLIPIVGAAVYLGYAGLHSDTMADAIDYADETGAGPGVETATFNK